MTCFFCNCVSCSCSERREGPSAGFPQQNSVVGLHSCPMVSGPPRDRPWPLGAGASMDGGGRVDPSMSPSQNRSGSSKHLLSAYYLLWGFPDILVGKESACNAGGGWVAGWLDEWVDGSVAGWMDGWMNGWLYGWVDGWVDG